METEVGFVIVGTEEVTMVETEKEVMAETKVAMEESKVQGGYGGECGGGGSGGYGGD